MEELILAIVKPLVDHPEDVKVEQKEDHDVLQLNLYVHPNDIGKVIGKKGRVAKAIRTVVYAAGANQHKKIHLEIVD
ncbi:KH domain-containing protein [Heyndrickxia ginsengihumi]|uniref:RNA-binding protein KhpA n=1 Tax=Heyndrickxia ginsengihumi TaxID=363870 RepID=A0A0A6Y1J9_9BACI|nr:KH domain-containing protein [Heyndrickxia ginsengihumi]KHD86162.1 RNA-binding protein [Heyndrickxia ginsengihumi]MBE6183885.1 KH domain-containing protein [Bacillus sp. (in: firmicutes)]MCM3022469.1 KH domain-containing protein [Heyndrickxia ginsengihumi]NEY19589.1 KH domain-containing protein [Heyndrickxia ginsengihumi]